MSSDDDGSSRALSDLALARLGRPAQRVLVGGLGMGFTLRAALDGVGPDAVVEVAELVEAVVQWNRGPLAELASRPLSDARTEVHLGDVRARIDRAAAVYDAILLDVDNGPDALAHPGNAAIYAASGLTAARRALRPGGVLAVWSYSDDAAFTRRCKQAGLPAQVERAPRRARVEAGTTTSGSRNDLELSATWQPGRRAFLALSRWAWHRRPVRRLAILGMMLFTGCVSVSLQRTPKADDSVEVSPPGEDGTRYVAVRGGRRTQAQALERKFARVATKACEGDYQLMSEGASESRRAGRVTSRQHEGFVRCLLPSEAGSEPESEADRERRDAAERRTAQRRP